MSCNGCRVLRKGCSDSCILRPCLQWIESPEAQGHAAVFVAKFFGRAGLMSFISAVQENQRPGLFQSLLFEACGRTVNPVNGAVGLLWTGNWNICQAAVETVLRGGALRPMPELLSSGGSPTPASNEASEVACTDIWKLQDPSPTSNFRFSSSRSNASAKRKRTDESPKLPQLQLKQQSADLDLLLSPRFSLHKQEIQRPGTPSRNSMESVTTTCFESGLGDHYSNGGGNRKLLNLFV
ncbi:putative LOB domain-containing protein [Tripterygium wilfordii]|uniref:Putative LOB domain-containing protein n=1 Tax=Tripterygium wilfordii TaxID=458696 RepID=A0A7J7E2F2_TRIWF|nr:LOB domain-containing protein 37-like [Tripterygium wilfordii]KAF5752842.1 putative LOB domain-containing protein [Tripterygium wilfordii]